MKAVTEVGFCRHATSCRPGRSPDPVGLLYYLRHTAKKKNHTQKLLQVWFNFSMLLKHSNFEEITILIVTVSDMTCCAFVY